MKGKVLTANRLTDGEVVYFSADDDWSNTLSAARFVTAEVEQESLLSTGEKDVARLLVVGPYLMEAERDEEGIKPISQRECIRANGPTVRTAFQ